MPPPGFADRLLKARVPYDLLLSPYTAVGYVDPCLTLPLETVKKSGQDESR